MSEVRVRKMRTEDLPACTAILAKWNMAPQPRSAAVPDPERTGIDVANGFVAEVDGSVVGTCTYIVHPGGLAETASLAVDPAYIGSDAGLLLQRARLAEMRQRGIRRVRTEADRPDVIAWYVKRFGYVIVGTNPKRHSFGRADIDHWTVLELDLEQ